MKALFTVISLLMINSTAQASNTTEDLSIKTANAKLDGKYYVRDLGVHEDQLIVTLSETYPNGSLNSYIVCGGHRDISIRYDILKSALLNQKKITATKDMNNRCLGNIWLN